MSRRISMITTERRTENVMPTAKKRRAAEEDRANRWGPLALVALCASAALWLVAPASAGTIYVALATNATVGGVGFGSRLAVTNTGTQPHFFVVHFVETFADGTERDESETGQIIGVPAGATYVYDDLGIGSQQTGMLEITGDDQLVFHASVVPRVGGVTGPPAQVPIVDDDTSKGGGERMVVQGLRRDARHLSSLTVVNLAQQSTPCNLALMTASSQLVIDTVAVTLPPLSHNFYPDVLGDSGVQQASDLRFEVTCSGAAYAFGLTIDREAPAVTTLDLATTLRSTLVPPGQDEPEPEPEPGLCPATSICLELPGVFHVATDGNRSFRRSIPVEAGRSFRRIDLEVTVTHGGWDKKYPDGIHNVFWLFSQKFAGNTWAYANARGPNRNLVTLSHNIGLAPNQNSRSAANLALQPAAPTGFATGTTPWPTWWNACGRARKAWSWLGCPTHLP